MSDTIQQRTECPDAALVAEYQQALLTHVGHERWFSQDMSDICPPDVTQTHSEALAKADKRLAEIQARMGEYGCGSCLSSGKCAGNRPPRIGVPHQDS